MVQTRMTRLARLVVRLYPSAWRARYAAEVLDLLEAAPVRFRDLTELTSGLILERGRALASSPASPRRTEAVLVLFGPVVVLVVVLAATVLGQLLRISAGAWPPSVALTGQVVLMVVVFGSLLARGARAIRQRDVRPSGALSVTLLALFVVTSVSAWGDLVRFDGLDHRVPARLVSVGAGLFFWVMGIGATRGLWPDRTILDAIDRREVAEQQLRLSRAWVEGCHATAVHGHPVPLAEAEAQVAHWETERQSATARLEAMGYLRWDRR